MTGATAAECPGPLTLFQYANGHLDPTQSERIAAHVRKCSQCSQRVQQTGDDGRSLADALEPRNPMALESAEDVLRRLDLDLDFDDITQPQEPMTPKARVPTPAPGGRPQLPPPAGFRGKGARSAPLPRRPTPMSKPPVRMMVPPSPPPRLAPVAPPPLYAEPKTQVAPPPRPPAPAKDPPLPRPPSGPSPASQPASGPPPIPVVRTSQSQKTKPVEARRSRRWLFASIVVFALIGVGAAGALILYPRFTGEELRWASVVGVFEGGEAGAETPSGTEPEAAAADGDAAKTDDAAKQDDPADGAAAAAEGGAVEGGIALEVDAATAAEGGAAAPAQGDAEAQAGPGDAAEHNDEAAGEAGNAAEGVAAARGGDAAAPTAANNAAQGGDAVQGGDAAQGGAAASDAAQGEAAASPAATPTAPSDPTVAKPPVAESTAPRYSEPVASRDPDEARDLAKRGALALRKSELAAAESLFLQALAHDPRNPTALGGLASLHFGQGQHRTALKFAAKAVSAAPQDADLRILLGDAYLETLAYANARREYEKAVALGHRNAPDRLSRLQERIAAP